MGEIDIDWDSIVKIAGVIIFFLAILPVFLFRLSSFVLIITIIYGIVLLIAKISDETAWYIFLGGLAISVIGFLISGLLFSVAGTQLGHFAIDESSGIIKIDNTLTSNLNSAYLSTVESLRPFFRGHYETEYYPGVIEKKNVVYYLENESYVVFYKESIYGERIGNIIPAGEEETKCFSEVCEMNIGLSNINRNHSLNVNLRFSVLVSSDGTNITVNKEFKNITMLPNHFEDVPFSIDYKANKYPYKAIIDWDKVNISLLENEFVKVKNETLFKEVDKTKEEIRKENATLSKQVWIVEDTLYESLINLGRFI